MRQLKPINKYILTTIAGITILISGLLYAEFLSGASCEYTCGQLKFQIFIMKALTISIAALPTIITWDMSRTKTVSKNSKPKSK